MPDNWHQRDISVHGCRNCGPTYHCAEDSMIDILEIDKKASEKEEDRKM
jgi:hypothetical protein